jgi:hypothetical protein
MSKKNRRTKAENFQLGIWGLFIASAGFFTASSLRNGDILSLLGSLFFLVACFVAIVPLVVPGADFSQEE